MCITMAKGRKPLQLISDPERRPEEPPFYAPAPSVSTPPASSQNAE